MMLKNFCLVGIFVTCTSTAVADMSTPFSWMSGSAENRLLNMQSGGEFDSGYADFEPATNWSANYSSSNGDTSSFSFNESGLFYDVYVSSASAAIGAIGEVMIAQGSSFVSIGDQSMEFTASSAISWNISILDQNTGETMHTNTDLSAQLDFVNGHTYVIQQFMIGTDNYISAGNYNFSMQFLEGAIPAPSAFALLSCGALFHRRRRT